MAEHLYVLGHPVAHSKSPAMHNAAYRALGLPWDYGFMDCPDEACAREFLADGCWLGANITMPYKPLALAAADRASDAARLAGGANVLVRTSGGLRADNTDGTGCIAYLQREGVDFRGAAVAVCGTGPTSQALMHAALQAGAASVCLLGRDGARSRAAVEAYRQRARELGLPAIAAAGGGAASGQQVLAGCSYAQGADALAGAAVVLDATPLGMAAGDPAPFDTGLLHEGQAVFDVVYGHGETALLAAARAAGCRAFDGAGMLVAQAVETVRDLVDWLEVPVDLQQADLFPLMAQAAGFDL